jgi:hypothetical protein
MTEQPNISASMLTGYYFSRHPDTSTLGILRLDTKDRPRWLMVTRKSLLALAAACVEHADDLTETQ